MNHLSNKNQSHVSFNGKCIYLERQFEIQFVQQSIEGVPCDNMVNVKSTIRKIHWITSHG